MEIVYGWANGAKFADICNLSEVYEGNITPIVSFITILINL